MGINWRKILTPGRAREEPAAEPAGTEETAEKVSSVEITDQQLYEVAADAAIRNLAFWTCVSRISSVLSQCEFRTFVEGREVFEGEYYLWNYSPNRNQNRAEFWDKALKQLFRNNELLIVESRDGQLLVADSFTTTPNTLYGDVYSNVSVGDYQFRREFRSEDVLHWTLNNENVNQVLRRMQDSYLKLIDYSMKTYVKSRGRHGTLDISAMARADKNFEKTFQKMMDEYFKTFFQADNAVLPLFDGYKYTDLESKTYSNESSRDIKNQFDDIFDFTARAFNLPPALAKSDVQDTKQAVEDMLMFCVDPLCSRLQTEINRKRNGPENIARGTELRIYSGCAKHIDMFDVAPAAEKLIGSGIYTVNMILRAVGEPMIDEEWADRHFMTKNFDYIENLIKLLGGGEET